MKAYRKVAGKLYNQAPYDPRVYKYHNVKPVEFQPVKVKKAPVVTDNTIKVQGKLHNDGVYDPKLNKYGITPQNYKQQYEKVQADIAIKQELTDKVTEAAAGDRMESERRKKNYAPILEQIASTGVVISKTITNPSDVVSMLKQAIDDTKKSVPKSQWGSKLPEIIKEVAMILINRVKTGEIAPERVPEFIDAIERDADLASVEVVPDGPDTTGFEEFYSEETFNTLVEILTTLLFSVYDGVQTYDEFLAAVDQRVPRIRDDADFNTVAGLMSPDAIKAAYYKALSERAQEPTIATEEEKLEWAGKWIYGDEYTAEEATEPSDDIGTFEGDEISFDNLLKKGMDIINAAPNGNWRELSDAIFIDDDSPRRLAINYLPEKDRKKLEELLENALANKLVLAGASDQDFADANVLRPEVAAIPESSAAPGELNYGIVKIDSDGDIFHAGIGPIGHYNDKRGKAIFTDGTGEQATYDISKDELVRQFTNGGDVVSAMMDSNPNVLSDYKNIKLLGKMLDNGYAIINMPGSRRLMLAGANEDFYQIEPLRNDVKLTRLTMRSPTDFIVERNAPTMTLPRKLFVAWVLLTSNSIPADKVDKTTRIIDTYDRPRYNRVYSEFKRFIGGDIADKGVDIIGFGKMTKKFHNAVVSELDRMIAGGAISKDDYVKVMKKLSK